MTQFIPNHLLAVHISGPDAVAFMQSQVTLDLGTSDSDHFYPAAWCDPKGRVLFVILMAHRQNHVMAVLPAIQADAIGKRLKMFQIGRKVNISEPQAVLARIGQAELSDKQAAGEDGPWLELKHDANRAIWFSASQAADSSRAPNQPAMTEWMQSDHAAGFPWLTAETSAQFIPQMLGLERLHGLSYKKGCYPGQEIVARVHYRGRVTRKLMKFEIISDEPIQAGLEIPIDGDKAVVLSAVENPNPDTHSNQTPSLIGLAVVAAATPDQQEFTLHQAKGRLLEL